MVSVVTVSSKYQIAIPREVRENLAIRPGERLVVLADGGVIRLVRQMDLAGARGPFRGMDGSDPRDHGDDRGRP